MGLNNLLCWFNFGGLKHTSIMNSMKIFQSEVAPELQKVKIEKGLIKKITSKKITLNKGVLDIP